MKKFGLIGRKLSHSFSQKYFSKKFEDLNLFDHFYELFELEQIAEVNEVFSIPNLAGINVTVPYKVDIIDFLSTLDESALKVGAVNVVKIDGEKNKTGYNTDYLGFKLSLQNWLPKNFTGNAIVLGTGGASKAVIAVLKDLNIDYKVVSRMPEAGQLSYSEIENKMSGEPMLIINTTPLGMSPNIDSFPELPYHLLNTNYYLYDLVYNPELTQFLLKGKKAGTQIKNGLDMLYLQAEESWKIWNTES
jgi:shikimate dehydrogenase